MGNSNLRLKHAHLRDWNVSALKVIIVLEGHIARSEVVIGRTMGLFEARELLAHLHLALKHSTEIPSREDTVVRNGVVH